MSSAPAATLNYSDADQCLALLRELPLTNVPALRDALTRLLYGLRQTPPAGADYLRVLEAMREALHFMQGKLAERYSTRPVAPGGQEDPVLRQVVALWLAMAQAYAQVAERSDGPGLPEDLLSLVCQRCVSYAGRGVLEYFRARREMPRGLWLDVHGYYETAEEWGLASQAVADPLKEDARAQTAAEAYAAVLLVDLANPYGRSPREFEWICRWADHYASLTEIMPVFGGTDARAYAVDLMRDRGAKPLEILARAPSLRRLVATRLGTEIERVVAALRQGEPPASLGLGQDCNAQSAGRLLVQLYRPWCQASNPRRFQRRDGGGALQIVQGFEAMHYFISAEEFVQPAPARIYSHVDYMDIVTFGERANKSDDLQVKRALAHDRYPVGQWSMLDHSVMGYRLHATGEADLLEYSQLVAIDTPEGEDWLLARVTWLMFEAGGKLQAGLHVLPGTPRGVAVRPGGAQANPAERYVRAFLLPAVQVLAEDATLILPRGWFQPGRELEIYLKDYSKPAKLTRLLQFGSNYERVAFEAGQAEVQG